MGNHKRKRPKNARAGCLLCKPWKANGVSTERDGAERFGDHRRRRFAGWEVAEYRRSRDLDRPR